MVDISKQTLMVLVLIAVVSSVGASAFTIVAIDKIDFIQDFYEEQFMADYLSNLPSGTVKLYVEPEPAIESGKIHLEIK